MEGVPDEVARFASSGVDTLRTSSCVDVVVIGAGIAGLYTAWILQSVYGKTVCVIEARDRVGGRIFDVESSVCGHRFPLGSSWFGPRESTLHEVLAALDLSTEEQVDGGGRVIIELDGRLERYDNEDLVQVGPICFPREAIPDDFLDAVQRLEEWSKCVSLEEPLACAAHQPLDAISLEEWCNENIQSNFGKKCFRLVVRQESGMELEDLSLLYMLFMWKSSVAKLVDDRLVHGGSMQICERFARAIGDSHLFLNAPVSRVTWNGDREVSVEYEGHGVVQAQCAVFAFSPALWGNVEFIPDLPAQKICLSQSMTVGNIIKCHILFETPFWRAHDLSGMILSDVGPLEVVIDSTPSDESVGALVGFITANEAKLWSLKSVADRKKAIFDQLQRLFQTEDGVHPVEYLEENWPVSSWTGGANYAGMPPHAMQDNGSFLRERIGNLFWCGTETAIEWNGCVEGALLSARRVVSEVLEYLNNRHNS